MDSVKLLCLCGILLVKIISQPVLVTGGNGLQKCKFPAIYNFGDSNSDTGAIAAAIPEVTSPNGETFFRHPSGRFCDGRLIIDFIAEKLKLPYLSPYLDSLGTDFRHGANFATGGSSIRRGGYSPFHLGIQISQFLHFKARSTALYNQLRPEPGKALPFKEVLPRPSDFSEALYTFDIGQNDLAYGFQHTNAKLVLKSIPNILSQFSDAVHQLYKEGARTFWVHNTGPIGCLPYSVIYDRSKPGNLDKIGCVKTQNEVAQEYNRQLKNKVSQLSSQLPHSVFTLVDVYSVKYQLISSAKSQGFVDPFEFCCGSYYGYHINCGKKAVVNGTVYGNPCKHPSKYISWDGIHYSEAANIWIANRILNGSHSSPPRSVDEACG